jgi:hypothetical protein
VISGSLAAGAGAAGGRAAIMRGAYSGLRGNASTGRVSLELVTAGARSLGLPGRLERTVSETDVIHRSKRASVLSEAEDT